MSNQKNIISKILTLVQVTVILTYCLEGGAQNATYHAALIVDGDRFCSGALISEHYIITKASCVHKAFVVDVILNSVNLIEFLGTAQITGSFIIHENYKKESDFLYDIALVQLPVDVDKTLKVLQLKKDNSEKSNTITGFNNEQLGSQEVEKNITTCRDFSLCSQYPDQFLSLTPTNPNNKPITNKFRNYGSPLVNGKYLVGLVVQMEDEATLAINIEPFIQWINNKVNN